MKCLLHRVLSHAQFSSDLSLCWPSTFAYEEFLQLVKQRRIARSLVLRFQSTEHLFQHRQGPVALVKPVSAQSFRELEVGGL